MKLVIEILYVFKTFSKKTILGKVKINSRFFESSNFMIARIFTNISVLLSTACSLTYSRNRLHLIIPLYTFIIVLNVEIEYSCTLSICLFQYHERDLLQEEEEQHLKTSSTFLTWKPSMSIKWNNKKPWIYPRDSFVVNIKCVFNKVISPI